MKEQVNSKLVTILSYYRGYSDKYYVSRGGSFLKISSHNPLLLPRLFRPTGETSSLTTNSPGHNPLLLPRLFRQPPD